MIEQTLEPTDEQTIAFTCMNRNGVSVWGYQSSSATGIKSIRTDPSAGSGADKWYNLQGQLVEHPRPGLYIKNGKKVIIR